MTARSTRFTPGYLALGITLLYGVASLSSMAGMSIGVGIAILATLSALQFNQPFRSKLLESAQPLFRRSDVRSLMKSAGAFAAAMALSLLWAALNPLTYGGEHAQIRILRDIGKLMYFLLPFLWAVMLGVMGTVRQVRLLQAWFVAAGVLGVLSVVQFFTGFPLPQPIPTSPRFFHATLFFGHHLSTASILIFPAFVALAVAFFGSKPTASEPLRRLRVLAAVSGALSVLALVLSFSRMIWIALPIGFVLLLSRFFDFRKNWKVGALIALVGISVISAAVLKSPALQERIRNPMGISTRFELWKTNLEFFEARPILGVGWRLNHELAHVRLNSLVSDPEVRKNTFIGHAHNNIIEMLAGTGLVGTLAWMLFNFQVLRMAWNSSRRSDLGSAVAWGVFCAWILLHLNGLTQVNFWEGKVMHQWTFALGLLLGFQLDKQRSSAQEL